MKKFIIFFIVMVLCCGAVMGGCSNTKNTQVTADKNHQFIIKETDEYIVKNGANTGYQIILPANASERLELASQELITFFKEATGITLSVGIDNGQLSTQGKYISIGETQLFNSAGITLDKVALGTDGVRVITKDNTIFLVGGGDDGALFAVYTLLEDLFNYDWFYQDCYSLDRNVTQVKLKDYNITDIPDMAVRIPNLGYLKNNMILGKRMKFSDSFLSGRIYVTNPDKTERGNNTHSSYVYIPPEYYNDLENNPEHYHPEWFASNGINQLCYMAGVKEGERVEGDSYSQMVDAVFEVVKFNLKKDTVNKIMMLGIQDFEMGWCSCSACSEVKEKYGVNSASVVMLLNNVNKKVKAWFETEDGKEYKRDFKLALLAYYGLVSAPAVDGKVKLKADPEIAVCYAPIEADFTRPFSAPENVVYYNNILKWSEVCDNLMFWVYSTIYTDFLIPLNIFNSQQENYQLFKKLNTIWVFNESQGGQAGGGTGWMVLKCYLDAKLAWNVNYDYNELIKKFFANYFGVANEEMTKIFNSVMTHWMVQEENGMKSMQSAYSSTTYKQEKWWPKSVLMGWLDMYDDALNKIEHLKYSDKKEYNALYKRITMERLTVYYMLVSFYDGTSTPEQVSFWKNTFKYDVGIAELNQISESAYVYQLLDSWGV